MNTLYFVAGASGSGKTAIINDLKQHIGDHVDVYDFDDIGVPSNADKEWRQQATEQWLQKLIVQKKDACLLGQIVLGEILACPSARNLDRVHFCLLDVSDTQRIIRLKKRDTYGATQNMLNWASWLRMHHQDPQWEQHVLKDGCWQELDFNQWDTLDNWKTLADVTTIDTTPLTIEQAASAVAQWIASPTPHKAHIIFLNGPSSAGKTTLVKLLQEKLAEPYLHIGIDKIIGLMPAKLNDWTSGQAVEQGFWWKVSTDQAGHPIAHIQCGPYAQKIASTYKDIVVTAAHNGHNIIIDEVCLDEKEWALWHQKLHPFNVLYVGVKANTSDLEAREQSRGNRMIGSARAQNATVHHNKHYDLEVNTSVQSLAECADSIIDAVNAW